MATKKLVGIKYNGKTVTPGASRSGQIGHANPAPLQRGLKPQPPKPPSSSVPAAPEPAPLPDPAFLAQQAQNQRTMALGNAWDTYARAGIENEYGLGSDVSNPFSRSQQMQLDYQRNQRGTELDYANSGQLYSGARQNATDYNAGKYSQNYDALKRQYQAQKDAITKGAMDRYAQAGASGTSADLQSIIAALGK